jgi:hypothetical protein
MIPASGDPLFGDCALVDSEPAFMLHRLILTGHDLPARVRVWASEQGQCPSVPASPDRVDSWRAP